MALADRGMRLSRCITAHRRGGAAAVVAAIRRERAARPRRSAPTCAMPPRRRRCRRRWSSDFGQLDVLVNSAAVMERADGGGHHARGLGRDPRPQPARAVPPGARGRTASGARSTAPSSTSPISAASSRGPNYAAHSISKAGVRDAHQGAGRSRSRPTCRSTPSRRERCWCPTTTARHGAKRLPRTTPLQAPRHAAGRGRRHALPGRARRLRDR